MSVTSQVVRTVTALGNGSNTNHTIGFPFQDNDHIEVYVEQQSADPYTLTLLVYGAGAGKYTITGGDPGTTVVMGTALSATQRAIIKRVSPKTQTVNHDSSLAFPADDFEEQSDKQVMSVLEVADDVSRSLKVWPTDTGIDPVFPAAPTGGELLRINDDGDGMDFGPTLDDFNADVAAAAANAVAAAASAAAAGVSAAAASASAAAAATAETNAELAETAAEAAQAAAEAAAASTGVPLHETPAGSVDDVNTTFTLSYTPITPTALGVFQNGLYQKQGTDYTLAGQTITFAVAPLTGDVIVACYNH